VMGISDFLRRTARLRKSKLTLSITGRRDARLVHFRRWRPAK
jgi:hypothetical protein